jgi:hypothetical protein
MGNIRSFEAYLRQALVKFCLKQYKLNKAGEEEIQSDEEDKVLLPEHIPDQ